MKNFCDQIDSHMPENRKDHQMIMTRMHNIGLLTEDECIDYIYNKFGEKDYPDISSKLFSS